ncbi:hypothetical protein GALMADRAFT_141149 [Galerina marginata CBS 339.88]|uniref:Uncharacterized protein n=1 Tax=Galerina marginata (strain CBS 339.88) TaxID=685588 RepID=A0A067SV99_GALM3|nr:hypothetical protein GALMADRAFT_141149 [Galerina marginata CBS 339.88]
MKTPPPSTERRQHTRKPPNTAFVPFQEHHVSRRQAETGLLSFIDRIESSSPTAKTCHVGAAADQHPIFPMAMIRRMTNDKRRTTNDGGSGSCGGGDDDQKYLRPFLGLSTSVPRSSTPNDHAPGTSEEGLTAAAAVAAVTTTATTGNSRKLLSVRRAASSFASGNVLVLVLLPSQPSNFPPPSSRAVLTPRVSQLASQPAAPHLHMHLHLHLGRPVESHPGTKDLRPRIKVAASTGNEDGRRAALGPSSDGGVQAGSVLLSPSSSWSAQLTFVHPAALQLSSSSLTHTLYPHTRSSVPPATAAESTNEERGGPERGLREWWHCC